MERAVQAAVSSGLRGLLLREPALEDGAFLKLAQRLRTVLDALDAEGSGWLGLHDRVHLVEVAGADAGHLGGRSLPLPAARLVVGPQIALGVSSHAGDSARFCDGADYALHAPVFEPSSKPSGGQKPLGVSAWADFAGEAPVPVWGLGGMTEERLQSFPANGAPWPAEQSRRPAGIGVIGGLWGTDSVPIDGTTMALRDVGGIARRAKALAALCNERFSSQPNAGTSTEGQEDV